MQRITMDLNKFWFNQFVDEILDFIRNNFNIEGEPIQGICWVEDYDNTVYYSDNNDRNLKSELLDERKKLFFPFTLPNFGEPIPCADGEEYSLEEQIEDFYMGTENIIGYQLEVVGEHLIINSAIYSGSTSHYPENIILLEDCSIFDYPMTDFILRFIKK